MISILYHAKRYNVKSFRFPGGEVQVEIPELPRNLNSDIKVIAQLQSSDDIMTLVMVTEIVRRLLPPGKKATLAIPYFPYARQDRVMIPNQAFSLKMMAKIINSLCYDRVTICDPHSDVTPALIKNVSVVTQLDCIRNHEELNKMMFSYRPQDRVVVSPDGGAMKKAFEAATYFNAQLVTACKVRDIHTGEITRTSVEGYCTGKDCLIVDDICDGGRTFIELARALKAHGAGSISLYVTHGIFSKGLSVFTGLIDNIYTTTSFGTVITEHVETPNLFISHIGAAHED